MAPTSVSNYTNLIGQEISAYLNFMTRIKTKQNPIFDPL